MMAWNGIRRFFGLAQRPGEFEKDRESVRYNVPVFARRLATGAFTERRGNVGIGGFCFEAEKEHEPGTRLDILFRLPGTCHWIQARGTVLGHTRAHGWLGVRGRFEEISFEDERILARWLDGMTLQIQSAAA